MDQPDPRKYRFPDYGQVPLVGGYNVVQCITLCYSIIQCVRVCYNVLQFVFCISVLQCVTGDSLKKRYRNIRY